MATTNDGIRHVIHLILENRSFDQMLGCLQGAGFDVDGVDPNKPFGNKDPDGKDYFQAPMQVRQMLKWDPRHELDHVAVQLENQNSGFLKDFCDFYPDSSIGARQAIMGYYPYGFLPALHVLAQHFCVCDKWFSSVPGPTWANRFFSLTGTSNGKVIMPGDDKQKTKLAEFFQQTQATLFDRLNERAVNWKVYFHDIPQTSVLDNQRVPHNVARYFYIDQFYEDARGSDEDFPQYCLIEPDYMGYGQNDGHPPHDIMRSEKLIADIYNALRANDALWKSSLFVVVFDEHGGFFDHVVPPPAVPPDLARDQYSFDQLGLRVPALLIGPWVKPGVEHSQFDHTSLLKYLTEKWSLGPLGARTAKAASISTALVNAPLAEGPTRIELTADQLSPPDPRAEEEIFGAPNCHQTALGRLAEWIEMEAVEAAPKIVVWLARRLETVKSWLDAWIFDTPQQFHVAVAKPDKLSLPYQTKAVDSIARFLMRGKKYAAVGIARRLNKEELPPEQHRYSVQTLAFMTGRNFHRESEDQRLDSAKRWLADPTK